MVADTGPIGGDLSHEFIILASTGESEVFCHKDYLSFAPPPEDIAFDDAGAVQAVVNKWTSLYAATSEKHDVAAFGALTRGFTGFGAGDRGRPYFLLWNQIFGSDESGRQRPRRQGACGAYGFLRHRALASGRGA